MSHLLCIGLGYSANVFAARMAMRGWRISGTSRSQAGRDAIAKQGWQGIRFDGQSTTSELAQCLGDATHILLSAPPDEFGDPLLRLHGAALGSATRIKWICYLSTIGVYGDHGGRWIDEDAPCHPVSVRSRQRLEAEKAWLEFGQQSGKRVLIFRLPGIYGPGRNAVENVLKRTARPVSKPGQVFNRVHVEDIASALEAGVIYEGAQAIFNVTDDEPAPNPDVIDFAAHLVGVPAPLPIPFEQAGLSEMAASFYSETKRVSNRCLKSELGVQLRYPTYREGLAAIAGMRA